MKKEGSKILTIKQYTASDVMTKDVIPVHMKDSIHDVAKVFVENNISGAPVIDDHRIPIGVITKTDLARYDQEQSNLVTAEVDKKEVHEAGGGKEFLKKGFHVEQEEATIESWMTPFIFDVHPNTKLINVTRKMIKYGLHHVVVTNKETRLIEGIITTFDLMRVLSTVLEEQ